MNIDEDDLEMKIFFENVNKLKILVKKHQEENPDVDLKIVNNLIDHGEEQIGFETFCDILIEFPISQQFYNEMEDICKYIEADIFYLENIKKYIKK